MNLPDCDEEVYTSGVTVAVVPSIGAEKMEVLVEAARGILGSTIKVDWYYVAGRAYLKTTGNPMLVLDAWHKVWK